MAEGIDLAEWWTFIHYAVLHHVATNDRNASVRCCGNLSPGVEMFLGLPPLKVIDPPGVERVGGDCQVETAWGRSASPKEVLVSGNVLVAKTGINFQVASNDQHGCGSSLVILNETVLKQSGSNEHSITSRNKLLLSCALPHEAYSSFWSSAF
ncbi:hypothetical protein [Ktedonosporobacter rubrisoli]|uniref:hypothetical protein n=1 Tax=Ktedonosporobacter rubrisoli TaxID=2509675 RepID=UPI001F5CAEB4|nr:hypothetical protein [Ktedonosporobacter rubrisoli]